MSAEIERKQQQTQQSAHFLIKTLSQNITQHRQRLKNNIENLDRLSPTQTMLRGYTIVNKADQVITSTHDLKAQDQIQLTMKDGQVDAEVKKVRCNHDE